MKKIYPLVFVLLTSCSVTKKTPAPDYYDIKSILQLMANSPIKYSIDVDSALSGTDLARQGNVDQTFNPDLYKIKTGEHAVSIVDRPKNDIVTKWMDAAEEMYSAQKYDSAISLHQKARALEPSYFKTCTLIGDSYYSKGQYDSAIAYFKTALRLNPYDYQAAWFMADSYRKKQDPDSAFKYLIKAWAINKNHKEINILMLDMAKQMHFVILEDRAKFHFEIDRKSAEAFAVNFKNSDAMEEMGLANCLAAVEAEPSLAGLRGNAKSHFGNCLIDHEQFLRSRIKANPIKYAINKRFLAIVDDHLFSAYLVWEILDNQNPHAILYQDESEIENIEKYIRKYVLIKSGA